MNTTNNRRGKLAHKAADGLNDVPTTSDLLEFKKFAKRIATSISSGSNESTQSTIGIYGDWGSGKTSFMKMIEQDLQDKDIYPIWFNAWKYDKEDNLWSALIQTILDQAQVRGKAYRRPLVKLRIWLANIRLGSGTWEVIKKLLPLATRLVLICLCFIVLGLHSNAVATFLSTWLLSTPVPSLGIQAFVKTAIAFIALMAADPFKLIDLFKGKLGIDFSKFSHHPSYREHIAFLDEFRKEFERIVKLIGQGEPLVIMIDDLDRCLPEKTIQVIEAIKNFLDIEGCIFILGLDRKLVEMAVAAKYKEIVTFDSDPKNQTTFKKAIYYEAYVDKIIQQPLLLPRISRARVEEFVKHLSIDEDIVKCASIFGVGLSPNPRKIKRVLRNFLFIRDVADEDIRSGKIKLGVLSKLIVIQNQLGDVYEMLEEKPSLLKDMETYYLSQKSLNPTKQEDEINQATREHADNLAIQYPELRRLLLVESLDESDSFQKADIYTYVSLIGALSEIRITTLKDNVSTTPETLREKQPDLVTHNSSTSTTPEATAPSSSPVIQKIWDVPYRRNPFFTGHQDVLSLLRDRLAPQNATLSAQPVALCGLGGIGKTQIALEYAYRYRDAYQAIFWVRAANQETLLNDFVNIAKLLVLPEAIGQDMSHIVTAVKSWLTKNIHWLLILDGADEVEEVKDFLPSAPTGHILLTTRAATTGGIAKSIEIEGMGAEDGALLLLRRSRVIGPDDPLNAASSADYETAKKIVEALDGLSLAIDQAGAYIEESGITNADYLHLYQQRSTDLLKRRGTTHDYPTPVANVFSLNFEKIAQRNLVAIDMLKLCAFLDPNLIAKEILMKSQPIAGDQLRLNKAMEELRRYSLIRNSAEQTLTIHPLVQAALKENMSKEEQHEWAEQAVRAVSSAFPEVKVNTWPQYQHYLLQAVACASIIEQWKMEFPEAIQLLLQAEIYLEVRGQYTHAAQLLAQALNIQEKMLGFRHPDVVHNLSNLAVLYTREGKYEQANELLHKVLAIQKEILDVNNPDTAHSLSNLADLYTIMGHYPEAEPLYQQAIFIFEQVLGVKHPDTARCSSNLAVLYTREGKYEQANELLHKVLAIQEEILGVNNPDTAHSLSNLADLYIQIGEYGSAEKSVRQALSIQEKTLDHNHPDIIRSREIVEQLVTKMHRKK